MSGLGLLTYGINFLCSDDCRHVGLGWNSFCSLQCVRWNLCHKTHHVGDNCAREHQGSNLLGSSHHGNAVWRLGVVSGKWWEHLQQEQIKVEVWDHVWWIARAGFNADGSSGRWKIVTCLFWIEGGVWLGLGGGNYFSGHGRECMVGLRWKWRMLPWEKVEGWMDWGGGAVSPNGSKCRVWIHCGVEGRGWTLHGDNGLQNSAICIVALRLLILINSSVCLSGWWNTSNAVWLKE